MKADATATHKDGKNSLTEIVLKKNDDYDKEDLFQP
jgi:hypothetical protein